MTNYDINYYPVSSYPYTCGGVTCGAAGWDLWGLYNNIDPDNAFRRGLPLNDTCYIWYVANGCAYGTNACVSLGRGYNVDMEVSTDGLTTDTPVAMVAYNYGFDGQSLNSDRGFRVDPRARLAYDVTQTDYSVGGWGKSALLYEINPLKWCIYPEIAVYRYDTHVIGTFRTLGNLAAYIDQDDTRRVITIRNYLYRGDTPRTNAPALWDDDGSIIEETPVIGLLKHRPINSNLQTSVGAYIRDGHADYDSTKVYNPFNQANTTFFYRSAGIVEGNARQHDIGFAIQIQANSVINGHDEVPDNNGRCTAFFAHFSDKVQYFDDVAYHWRYSLYDETIDRELPNGYDLTGKGGHALRIMSVLEIDDPKDAATCGEAVRRAVLHEIAFIGVYFADTSDRAANDPLGSATEGTGIYFPEKISGVTTGRYYTGDDIKTAPNADADSSDVFQYNPPVTDDTGDFSSQTNTGKISCGVKYYALTEAQMNDLSTWLNTTYTPTDETQLVQDFKGVNPADYISCVLYYPFDVPIGSSYVDEEITVGKLGTGNFGTVLDYTYGQLYDYGYYDIPAQGNFMDYMRKITVFVPFCGTKDLDPIMWTGHRLTVKMAIDWPTGVCTAFLYRDTGVWDTISGSIGTPLPLSALANGNYQVAITNMLAQKNQATIGSITRGVSGVASIAGGALDLKSAGSVSAGSVADIAAGAVNTAGAAAGAFVSLPNLQYNIDHTQPQISQIDGGSPFINCGVDYRVKIFIGTPKTDAGFNAAAYGKTTGYACCKQGKLSDISRGYTECAGADLSGIAATATEKSMIFNALKGGVFI